jgi:hypothetical protein
VDAAYREASAIFEGRFVRAEYRKGIKNQFREMHLDGDKDIDYEVLVYKFEVTNWWKGGTSREVILISDTTRSKDGRETVSDCGLGFEEGHQYLVYAYGSGDDFSTGACTRTASAHGAAKDLRRLKSIAHSRKPGS